MATDVEVRESHAQIPLNLAEQTDLERLESTIAANLAAFFKVGFALLEVKRRKLYRGEFKTFEGYCLKRWEMHRAYAYRLIGAAEVYKVLSPMGDIPLPECERQIRPLIGLTPVIALKAWRRAVAEVGTTGKITGAVIQKALGEVTRKAKAGEEHKFKANWQFHLEPLLNDALRLTKIGDQEAVAEIIDRVSLLLLVGRRSVERDPADW
jgi:hypothetical protein